MLAVNAFAQTAAPRPDDTPKINLGALIYADYTFQESPKAHDADNNEVNPSSFNVTRAYINVTGSLNHYLSFRVTPDIVRAGSDSSLAGSQTFRLKYAYAQLNLDDWTTKGSWLRGGMVTTPYIEYEETIYKYRFQGPTFPDRIGLTTASDYGISGRYVFARDYGDVVAGIYNGEGFNHPETNNQKSKEARVTVRPLPRGGVWKGLRVTGFVNDDHYVENAKRFRAFGEVSFEHPRAVGGVTFVQSKDQVSVKAPEVDGKGWSAWMAPKLTNNGWELLLRHDNFKPDRRAAAQKRNIVGVAYWLQGLQRVTSAVMLDYDSLERVGQPNLTNYGVKLLINF